MAGNWFAFLVLIAWVPFVGFVFHRHAKLGSVISCLVAGILFLPSTIVNLPLLPPLDRASIPTLTVFAAVWIVDRRALSLRRLPWVIKILFAVALIGILLTVVRNSQSIALGGRVLEGLTYYEGFSFVLRVSFTSLLPFFLGYCVIHHPKDLKLILIVLAIAGFIYSFFVVYELVMSPRLHKIIYGFRQHSFAQTKRFGGWRPMVFMSHGLEVALFMTSSALAACGIAKARVKGLPLSSRWVAFYLILVTVLCKSMASWFYVLFVVPAIWFLPRKRQMQAVVLCACLVISYPVLRVEGWFPTDILATQMAKINEDRARSLRFRFDNEILIVDHAKEHLIAGWGRHGRSQVYDDRSGKLASVPDGYWLVLLSTRGVMGLVASFGLILFPLFVAYRRFPSLRSKRERIYVSTLCWIVAVIALDLLPNAMVNSLTYFLPGALLAAVSKPRKVRKRKKPEPAPAVALKESENPPAPAAAQLGKGLL